MMVSKLCIIFSLLLPCIYGFCYKTFGRIDKTVSGREIPVCEYNGLDILDGSTFSTAACMECTCNQGYLACCGYGINGPKIDVPSGCKVIADGCVAVLVRSDNEELDCYTGEVITYKTPLIGGVTGHDTMIASTGINEAGGLPIDMSMLHLDFNQQVSTMDPLTAQNALLDSMIMQDMMGNVGIAGVTSTLSSGDVVLNNTAGAAAGNGTGNATQLSGNVESGSTSAAATTEMNIIDPNVWDQMLAASAGLYDTTLNHNPDGVPIFDGTSNAIQSIGDIPVLKQHHGDPFYESLGKSLLGHTGGYIMGNAGNLMGNNHGDIMGHTGSGLISNSGSNLNGNTGGLFLENSGVDAPNSGSGFFRQEDNIFSHNVGNGVGNINGNFVGSNAGRPLKSTVDSNINAMYGSSRYDTVTTPPSDMLGNFLIMSKIADFPSL